MYPNEPATPAGAGGLGTRSTAAGQQRLVWFALTLIPFALLAVRHWSWAPPASDGDYAQYLLHAKALIEGRPYTETGYIFHPDAWTIGPRAYPPGLPLTLAPIVALGGTHSPMIRLLMLASLVAFAWFAYRRLSVDVAPWQAAVGAGFAVFAIEARGGTLAPISDPGFAALMWGTILAVDTMERWTWRRILLVTALGGAALAYRLTGAALVGALAIYAILTWRKHGGRAAIPLGIWTAGGVVALLIGLVQVGDVLGVLGGVGAPIGRLKAWLFQYRLAVFEMELYPTRISMVNLLYHAVASAFLLWGAVILVRRTWRSFLAVTCLVYVVMLLTSPVGEERYLWPLYPIGAGALAIGLADVATRLSKKWPSLHGVQVVKASLGLVALAALFSEAGRQPPMPLVGTPDAEELFVWLRDASSTNPMRIAFSNPRVVTLETGVPAMGNVERTAPGHLTAYGERRITHLIWERDDKSDCLQKIANLLPEKYPTRFALVHENLTFRVYRLLPGPGPAPADSSGRRLGWTETKFCERGDPEPN